MSDNSLRWPGSDGKPGLNFSPSRGDKRTDAAVDNDDSDGATSAQDQTRAQSAVSPAAPTSAGSPSRASSPAPVPSPAHASSPSETSVGGPEAKPSNERPNAPRVAPSVAERAARAAKQWATTPVGQSNRSGSTKADAAKVGAGVAAGAAVAGSTRTAPVQGPSPAPSRGAAGGQSEVVEARPARVLGGRRTRKARLRLSRIDPWSVMKTTFLFAIAFGIMLVVATFVLWSVLNATGALDAVNSFMNQLLGDQDTTFDLAEVLSIQRILGFAALVAAINVVIITALATLFAFLYNLSATVLGGLEVTLAED